MTCIHGRQLSLCATCAPLADAYYTRHQRQATPPELACCAETIDAYVDVVWPIEGPTKLRCHCGNLWQFNHEKQTWVDIT